MPPPPPQVVLTQPVSGLMRPAKDSPRRGLWRLAHKGVGYFLAPTGVLLCLLGACLLKEPAPVFVPLLLLALGYAGYVGRKAHLAYQERQAAAAGGGGRAAMPPEWTSAVDPTSNREYYVNKTTGAVQWEMPTLGGGGAADAPPPPPPPPTSSTKEQWVEANDPSSGRVYYYNVATGETAWTKPE